ncbi:hypothetical protein DACRYDRAFT_25320 [Dacryopinax primogenitus]|uniref:Uncharacterized protein n=1 Tax=Dacryopinax primogenitus (strain DJM 731) TaxID=1858805 RepID=M5G0B4_DACPD|nr:uncharacterized protein DACRYDRAFT_25320 [Dacryopinax primogenitus]EJT97232.1 hypothetical protein DACRYDRAFT_25320 [Dacryopinax primogenitus]
MQTHCVVLITLFATSVIGLTLATYMDVSLTEEGYLWGRATVEEADKAADAAWKIHAKKKVDNVANQVRHDVLTEIHPKSHPENAEAHALSEKARDKAVLWDIGTDRVATAFENQYLYHPDRTPEDLQTAYEKNEQNKAEFESAAEAFRKAHRTLTVVRQRNPVMVQRAIDEAARAEARFKKAVWKYKRSDALVTHITPPRLSLFGAPRGPSHAPKPSHAPGPSHAVP